MTAETIKQALIRLGYQPRRIEADDGTLMGMEILKDGSPVHATRFAHSDYAIELIESRGGFIQESNEQ